MDARCRILEVCKAVACVPRILGIQGTGAWVGDNSTLELINVMWSVS